MHPYCHDDGRIGRFPMNSLHASAGHPWTALRMSRLEEYMKALETASVKGQIKPLAEFIAHEMRQWDPEREGSDDGPCSLLPKSRPYCDC
jgi:hypothetical protein